jgi:hypothetical protein
VGVSASKSCRPVQYVAKGSMVSVQDAERRHRSVCSVFGVVMGTYLLNTPSIWNRAELGGIVPQ